MFEGNNCFHAPCDTTGRTAPAFTKQHSEGWCSIIGGQVYRGACFPDLVGTYFFTDYCAHPLEEAHANPDGTATVIEASNVQTIGIDGTVQAGTPVTPSAIHADAQGELYMTTVSCCGTSLTGGVYHLEVTQ